jgi:DUF4097 and DUF4098 domain-containing protein YvlB
MISTFSQFRTTILVLSVVLFFGLVSEASAQKKFSSTYVAQKNVRIQLMNRSGTVTVEGWDKDKIQIDAVMEAPAALIEPQNLSGTIVINVVKDNQGRNDVGNVNFRIRVPYTSSVDIQTMIGNLTVRNISGGLVRAHITSEGDIELTNINSKTVSAENVIGNIFFDGELKSGGTYRFASTRGDINIRIPTSTIMSLVATAPSTRSISLGGLPNAGFRFTSDGRRVVGKSGDGGAILNVTNQRGNIAFLSR